MTEQQKILRVLRLIKILSEKPYRTIAEIQALLEVSQSTVYKYLYLLNDLGYLYDKDGEGRHFLFQESSAFTSGFEPEEINLLNQLISNIDGTNPLRQSLLKKVYFSSSLIPLAEDLVDRHLAKSVERIHVALNDKKQVKLVRYHSPNSGKISDRVVEPLELVRMNSQLVAYDIENGSIKHFKVKKIEDVIVLNTSCVFNRETHPTDIFGFTASEGILVNLKLSERAYRLMIEEFPESRAFITALENEQVFPYQFLYEVRNPVGIGRFILGLPGEIKVETPLLLIEYLKNKIQRYEFFSEVEKTSS